jgi:transposase
MEQFVGLDVSQDITHVCVIGSDGKIVWQGTCLSTPEGISSAVKAKAPNAIRIGLESGPLSTWHWHALKAEGLPIVCLDARHAKAALNMQMNKTDKNDAHGLAQIVKAGWYREVDVKSLDSHTVRSMLGARAQLVAMRVEVSNQIRGMLKTFGVVLRRRDGLSFETLVSEAWRARCWSRGPHRTGLAYDLQRLEAANSLPRPRAGALCQGKRDMPAADDHSGNWAVDGDRLHHRDR